MMCVVIDHDHFRCTLKPTIFTLHMILREFNCHCISGVLNTFMEDNVSVFHIFLCVNQESVYDVHYVSLQTKSNIHIFKRKSVQY